ncbi:hypothetical protein C8Q74DRAFT_1221898 [Fomes fomentarius]|nr:hypothetical protein C8Q74DRAFT_1221898 [Fomes fomentarius]
MSDNSQTAQQVGEYNSAQFDDYAETAVLCLLAYEYVITFDREMKLFWKQSITGSSILFIANRYLSLVAAMLDTPYPDPTTTKYLPWALFSTLRAHALSSGTHGQWSISTLVLLFSLAPLVINFVRMGYWSVVGNSDGCIITQATTMNYSFLILTIISKVCLITSDLLVLCITWKVTYKTSRENKALGQGTSLSSILFRNGTLYFGILTTLNILRLSFTLLLVLIGPTGSPQCSDTPALSTIVDVKSELQPCHRIIGLIVASTRGESEVQSVSQVNDGEMEMERLDNGVVVPDSIDGMP